MNNQDRAAQVLRTFPLFVSKLFTQDERQDAISAIAAHGQERYRAGVVAIRDGVSRFTNDYGDTYINLEDLEETAAKLLAEQGEKK